MSGRGPDPKDLRASLVDSGWSMAPPEAAPTAPMHLPETGSAEADERRLPNYEDLSQAPAVTQVDEDIQSRLQAMQRGSMADAPRSPLMKLPRPFATRTPPPSLPPPPPPSAPPPPPSDAPLPRFDATSSPDAEEPLSTYATTHDPDLSEATEISFRGAVLPPSDPPHLRAPSLGAPNLSPPSLVTAPSLLAALKQRVRFAGGEVPLWSLLTPMVLLLALGSAFVAAAISGPDEVRTGVAPGQAPDDAASAASAVVSAAATSEPAHAVPAPALPASTADTEALEARRAEELTKDEALRLAAARRQREATRIVQLRQKLGRDPGLFKDAATLGELRRAAEDPLTAPDALSAMAEAPGPLSADLLYEMWTGTVARNGATELARSLVFSKEVRAKASPELAVALELRIAETCEQNRALLPKVTEKGDRRSLALLAKLSRRYGCGVSKRQDCYACLREDKAVDDAMTAVKKRREPKPFLGK
ncbi:MAG TPA: hypothetical protein VJN18_34740 [Polyangiaceae bacterium]|nr:hypothetical protein [Polyangiaceae bacterium]